MKFLVIETSTLVRKIDVIDAPTRDDAEKIARTKMRGGIGLCLCWREWDEGGSELILIEEETS